MPLPPMSMCFVFGMGGDCGVDCEVYKDGECENPEGIEEKRGDTMTTSERPDLEHLRESLETGYRPYPAITRWLLDMLEEAAEIINVNVFFDKLADDWLAKYRGEDGD